MDQIFEPTERLRLTLTVPDEFSNLNGRLLIKSGLNHIAEGEIMHSMKTACILATHLAGLNYIYACYMHIHAPY